MVEQAPNPTRDANGLPLCSQDACALYDGKRCSALGFRPDRFCEPALVELESVRVEQAAKLRRHLDELAAARARIEEYEALLLACPFGHHGGKINWHRATTEADLVAWVDRVHEAGRACRAIRRESDALDARISPAMNAATTIEKAPPEDLLDRITPEGACRHRRVSLRPDPHGNPEITCLDCGEPTNT